MSETRLIKHRRRKCCAHAWYELVKHNLCILWFSFLYLVQRGDEIGLGLLNKTIEGEGIDLRR